MSSSGQRRRRSACARRWFQFGHGSWRAKDLYDLWLIDRHVTLSQEALVTAVGAAFTHLCMELSLTRRPLPLQRGVGREPRQSAPLGELRAQVGRRCVECGPAGPFRGHRARPRPPLADLCCARSRGPALDAIGPFLVSRLSEREPRTPAGLGA